MVMNDVNNESVNLAVAGAASQDAGNIFLTLSSYVLLYVFFAVCSLVLIAAGRAMYSFERSLTPFHSVLMLWIILLGFPVSPLFGYKIAILSAVGLSTGVLSSILCLILVAFAWVQFCKLISMTSKLNILSSRRGMEVSNSQATELAITISVIVVLGFVVGLTMPILI